MTGVQTCALPIFALFRFILPTKEIRICGGRQTNLRSLQSLIFMAGADAIIIGNYLTTKGSAPEDDIQMVEDLGFKIVDRDNPLNKDALL